jgi:hypothetical protein
MKQLIKICSLALFVCAFAISSSTALAAKKAAPPNWKVSITGSSTFEGITVEDEVPFRTDLDEFSGHSSHLGEVTGTGQHSLNLVDFTFEGDATYVAANGDELHVVYSGQLFPSENAEFPFGFLANVEIIGGTGRFTDASGGGVMSGGFTGDVPVGDFYLNVEGALTTH